MRSSSRCLNGLATLYASLAFLLVALGAAVAVAADAPGGVGTDGIDITKIIGVNYLGTDQWVEIANKGTGSMILTGWTLTNMENQTWLFPADFTLRAGTIVRVHTGKGDNTAADLFNSTLLWKEEGDTATLRDATGKVVSEYKYPVEVSAQESTTKAKPVYLPDTSSLGGTSMPFIPDYRSSYAAEESGMKSSIPANLSGRPFICHGGPLNWAWTSGLG